MTVVLLLVVVGLLVVWFRLREVRRHLYSLSPMPGWIWVKGEGGEVRIEGGSFHIEGPHGFRGPELTIAAVPGTLDRFPYNHFDGRVTEEERVKGGGFDIALSTPTLPDMPLPPRIRLEFRDDTLMIRTWQARVANAEWHTGDEY